MATSKFSGSLNSQKLDSAAFDSPCILGSDTIILTLSLSAVFKPARNAACTKFAWWLSKGLSQIISDLGKSRKFLKVAYLNDPKPKATATNLNCSSLCLIRDKDSPFRSPIICISANEWTSEWPTKPLLKELLWVAFWVAI